MKCKNDSTRSYTGKEKSPMGLGHCASAERVGTVRRGKDRRSWIVKKDRLGRKRWSLHTTKTNAAKNKAGAKGKKGGKVDKAGAKGRKRSAKGGKGVKGNNTGTLYSYSYDGHYYGYLVVWGTEYVSVYDRGTDVVYPSNKNPDPRLYHRLLFRLRPERVWMGSALHPGGSILIQYDTDMYIALLGTRIVGYKDNVGVAHFSSDHGIVLTSDRRFLLLRQDRQVSLDDLDISKDVDEKELFQAFRDKRKKQKPLKETLYDKKRIGDVINSSVLRKHMKDGMLVATLPKGSVVYRAVRPGQFKPSLCKPCWFGTLFNTAHMYKEEYGASSIVQGYRTTRDLSLLVMDHAATVRRVTHVLGMSTVPDNLQGRVFYVDEQDKVYRDSMLDEDVKYAKKICKTFDVDGWVHPIMRLYARDAKTRAELRKKKTLFAEEMMVCDMKAF